MTLQKLFLTFFGSGLSPKAPGTVGTLASLPFGVIIIDTMGVDTLFMLTLAITIIGIFEINKYEKITGIHDQQEIVIDETAGIWLTLMISYSTLSTLSFEYAEVTTIILSFLSFRLFDIWKPSTIGVIDKKVDGGLGVMGDDILAGFAGGFLTVLILLGIEKLYLSLFVIN
ncbi:Phosphatidylglycerophosphatase A [hydrothermal vent metagenome]|uniref:Phosphatidylglycerophosphatase A n=1 Tax=hydrothermal vent metagenome TaxID=652676 RepID=A0A1W1BD89_9ZZZZ